MLVFISHASEDKADFVRPLANALSSHHQIWYDEYELVIGDSLLGKINEGLNKCDYGVVILSPSFFRKKWPQAELDGLFALETTVRKMILPIWKDVTFDEVKSFSPILAGHFAGKASDGIEKVVNDLCRAIEVSNRTKEIVTVNPVIERAKSLNLSLKEQQNAFHLSHCEEGVELVKKEFATLYKIIHGAVVEIKKHSELLAWTVEEIQLNYDPLFIINTRQHARVVASLIGLGGNWTHETEFIVEVQKMGAFREQPITVKEIRVKPTFLLPKSVVWVTNHKKQFTSKELADFILENLMSEIERMVPNSHE